MRKYFGKYTKTIVCLISLMLVTMCTACSSKGDDKSTEQKESTSKVESVTDGSESNSENTTNVGDEEKTSNQGSSETTVGTENSTSEPENSTTVGGEQTTKPSQGGNEQTTKPSQGGSEQQTTSGSSTKPTEPAKTELETKLDTIINRLFNSSMTELEKVVLINDYMVFNIDNHEVTSPASNALGILKTGKATGAGYADLFYEFAKRVGLEVKVVTGTADRGNGYVSAVWNQVKVDGVWYNIDVYFNDMETTEDGHYFDHLTLSYQYFLVSDTELAKDHKVSNASAVATCAKNYDAYTIAKVIEKISYGRTCIGANKTDDIASMIKKVLGNTIDGSIEIYLPCSVEEGLESIERAINKANAPYRPFGKMDFERGMSKFYLLEMNGLKILSTLDELVECAKQTKGDWKERMYRYYFPEDMSDDEAHLIIDTTLIKAGVDGYVGGYFPIAFGRVDFELSELTNHLVVDDFAEIGEFAKKEENNLFARYIYYIGEDMTKEEIVNKLLKNGIYPMSAGADRFYYYNGVLSFMLSDYELVDYFDSVTALKQKLVSDFDSIKGKKIAVKVDDSIANAELYIDEFRFAIGFDFEWSECLLYHGHLILQLDKLIDNVYFARNLAELTAHIKAVDAKDAFGISTFYYMDVNADLNGEAANVEELIAATGCNVEIVEHWYSYGTKHEFKLKKAN